MPSGLDVLFDLQGGVATSGQLLDFMSRRDLERMLNTGEMAKVWPGIYGRSEPDLALKLKGLDLRAREPVAMCLGTAAATYGFDTEGTTDLHVLTPTGHQLRNCDGLVVHRRDGAPLVDVDGRPATAAAWTAVEVARSLKRPRSLATLDAALRSRTCTRHDLLRAAAAQAGRRGIVSVRDLIRLAAPEPESPMESEARLAMLDGGLPPPVLQFDIVDRNWRTWRVDFAWPDQKLAVEYDGFDWHSGPDDLRRDRQKRAALNEIDWRVLSFVADDVRRRQPDMIRRIDLELARPCAA